MKPHPEAGISSFWMSRHAVHFKLPSNLMHDWLCERRAEDRKTTSKYIKSMVMKSEMFRLRCQCLSFPSCGDQMSISRSSASNGLMIIFPNQFCVSHVLSLGMKSIKKLMIVMSEHLKTSNELFGIQMIACKSWHTRVWRKSFYGERCVMMFDWQTAHVKREEHIRPVFRQEYIKRTLSLVTTLWPQDSVFGS